MRPYVILILNGRDIMKILNITASMLVFALLSSLSCANNELNNELGGATPTRTTTVVGDATVATTGPTPTTSPLTRLLWLPVKTGKSLGVGIIVGGLAVYNGAYEAFLAVSNKGRHLKESKQGDGTSFSPAKYSEVLDDNNQRWDRFKLGLYGMVPGSVGGLFLGTTLYFLNSDEYGNLTTSSSGTGGPQSDQPSPSRTLVSSFLGRLTLPAIVADRIANSKQ